MTEFNFIKKFNWNKLKDGFNFFLNIHQNNQNILEHDVAVPESLSYNNYDKTLIGCKLEARDRSNPGMLCVATIGKNRIDLI